MCSSVIDILTLLLNITIKHTLTHHSSMCCTGYQTRRTNNRHVSSGDGDEDGFEEKDENDDDVKNSTERKVSSSIGHRLFNEFFSGGRKRVRSRGDSRGAMKHARNKDEKRGVANKFSSLSLVEKEKEEDENLYVSLMFFFFISSAHSFTHTLEIYDDEYLKRSKTQAFIEKTVSKRGIILLLLLIIIITIIIITTRHVPVVRTTCLISRTTH